jgi:hypothetical protein
MSAAAIAIIVVVAVVVLVFFAMAMTRRRLQQRFGPEYDRVVGEKRGQFRAAAELARRERRVQRLRIRPLSATVRAEYVAEWRAVQESFVDQPRYAVTDGQDLLASVMKERGYPAENPDQIAADLSVTHAATLDHYRAAQEVSANAERGDASTEDLREALIDLRVVFAELLGKPDDAEPAESVEERPRVLPAGVQIPRPRAHNAGVPDGVSPVPDDASAVPDGASRVPDGASRVPDGASRVPDGASRVPDGASRVPDIAARDDASSDGAARDDAVRAGAVRDPVASDDVTGDGAARDGAVTNDSVRDGVASDGAASHEPEEQLWRPGIRVPPARTSSEETQ